MNPGTAGRQIPVVVLAGFLGSGKTTLLNHLLRHRAGNRIAVVVNDFGAVEIDAMTVAGQVGSAVSLGNGCLCCAVDASELDGYLERLSRPAARIDLIVIEASGLAEPQELVRMILAGDSPRTVYGGLVEVVDAAEFDATRDRHPETDRHLAMADLVVLNKTDRVTPAEHERVLGVIGTLGPGAAVVSASYGKIDPGLLFDPATRPAEDEKVRQLSFEDLHDDEEQDHARHPHAAYESVSYDEPAAMDPRLLMAFLDSRPEGLYRIKGFVDFGAADPDNRYAIHAVGRFLRFYPEPWPRGTGRRTQLVLIGSGIDRDALAKELAVCAVTPADAEIHDGAGAGAGAGEDGGAGTGEDAGADGSAMWGVLRYVRSEPAADEAADPL